jgi:hypothetical protein
MNNKMLRDKGQILLNYLPGKTFDYAGISTIAIVNRIRGIPNVKINPELLLGAIQEYANAWSIQHRPLLSDRRLDINNFVLLEPKGVEAEMFPLVFHCQNRSCGFVITRTVDNMPRSRACPKCKSDMEQLSFIKIHRCGEIQPLTPYCPDCHSGHNMTLNTRDSERLSGFQWKCLTCGKKYSLFGGPCRACNWTDPVFGIPKPQNMDIEKFRAGRTYYTHKIVLLNQPSKEMDAFLQVPEWPLIAGAAFLELPEIQGQRLLDFGAASSSSSVSDTGISNTDLDNILLKARKGEITAEQMAAEIEQSRTRRMNTIKDTAPQNISRTLIARTGIAENIWRAAGRELLEAVLPIQSSTVQELFTDSPPPNMANLGEVRKTARNSGIARLTSVNDFPITSASFGYSRADYQPDRCRLNIFPPDPEHGGKFPIFVDLIQADALVIRLDAERVWQWLAKNNAAPNVDIQDPLRKQAYFIDLFSQEDIQPTVTLRNEQLQARMVFGLLHTLSHMCIRQAALLCGLDRTSLAEYVLPRTLSFAMYCSHRFGATIGALTSLFEQSMLEWLGQVKDIRRCVYDPVCDSKGGNCHACTHLAETSCRFFNLNLSRAFLFGGVDNANGDLHEIQFGYFDASLNEDDTE